MLESFVAKEEQERRKIHTPTVSIAAAVRADGVKLLQRGPQFRAHLLAEDVDGNQ